MQQQWPTQNKSDSHAEEKMLDLDSTETQNEDSPRLETTATQPQYRLPHEFKARAPRFFADNNNEDVPTPNICP